MDKHELAQNLKDRHRDFYNLIEQLSPEEFTFHPVGKWSAAQQLDHIIRSISPVILGLSLPKFLLRLVFGRAKRPSMDYDTLVKTYQAALAKGGKSPRAYEPKIDAAYFQAVGPVKLLEFVSRLIQLLESLSDEDLDQLQAPHPLIGKITLRELMYFTLYHVQHHQRSIQQGLASK